MITITHWKSVPPFAQGLTRDLRVRWALEEAGLPYRMRQIDFRDRDTPEHRARQPFGQAPVLDDNGIEFFESGAIVLHIGEKSDALLPADRAGRARAVTWLLAALNTVEPPIAILAETDLFLANDPAAQACRPAAEARVRRRLAELAAWIGDRDWLEDRFTAADLMMTSVLQILRHTDLVAEEPALAAYVGRCTARPAYRRAHADHMAAFEKQPA